MNTNFIRYIKDISRPLRYRLFLSEKERLVLKNCFLPAELSKRVLKYNLSDVNFSHKKHVIYTCVTGGYDEPIVPTFYNKNWDYIFFTDNKELLEKKVLGPWQIRSLQFSELSNALNNRWHKINPHLLFPDYDDSIYIDGNIDMLDDNLFRQIENHQPALMLVPKHPTNDCIYKEIKINLKNRRISKEQAENIYNILKKDKYPKHYGLLENNIIYRKHNDRKIIYLMEYWWKFIKDVVPRDQLSFCYLLWKNGIKPDEIKIDCPRLLIDSYHFYYDFSSRKHK